MRLALTRAFARVLSQTLPHLVTFTLMLLLLMPQAGSFWECEGRQCGITAWTCCCAVGEGRCDQATCQNPHRNHSAEVGPCPLGCHCKMVVQERAPAFFSETFAFASPIVFVVPVIYSPKPEAPTYTEVVCPRPSRGPPPRTAFFKSFPLRGPPSPDASDFRAESIGARL